MTCARVVREAWPLFQAAGGGSSPARALQVRDLRFEPCGIQHARQLVMAWHSRAPVVQRGPWQFAFHAEHGGQSYAVALWHNPSTRCLPAHWLELRRMACADDAPRNTASAFLAWMVRYFAAHHPEREMCISYQDAAVHAGTMYKAAGWRIGRVQAPRVRDRSKPRRGTSRAYRTNSNGASVDASEKIRWQIPLAARELMGA